MLDLHVHLSLQALTIIFSMCRFHKTYFQDRRTIPDARGTMVERLVFGVACHLSQRYMQK